MADVYWQINSWDCICIKGADPHIIEITNKIATINTYVWYNEKALSIPKEKEDRRSPSIKHTFESEHMSRFISSLRHLGNQEIDRDYLKQLHEEIVKLVNLLDLDSCDGIALMAGLLDGTRKRYTPNEDIVRYLQQEKAIKRAVQYGKVERKMRFAPSKMLEDE